MADRKRKPWKSPTRAPEKNRRLGKIKEIIVQRDGEGVAGFVVVHGKTIVGTGGTRQMIPASAVYSIGPDAMTVRGSAMKQGLVSIPLIGTFESSPLRISREDV